MFRRLIALFVCLTFIVSSCPTVVFAQDFRVNDLPVPGTMVSVSPAFEPALIKGLTVHKDNPFLFDFIVDPGDSSRHSERSEESQQEQLKIQADRMIKYFFAALTIPDKDIWVNLSPYEKDRMVPVSLGETAMGRDLLAQDYLLKQLTASLIYPQKALGKTFWDTVYSKAKAMYGTTQIPVNTFNKVWIVPQRVGIYEHGQTAFIVNGHLKVMLEEDYLALNRHSEPQRGEESLKEQPLGSSLRDSSVATLPQNDGHALASQIIRQIILPEIEKEINEGKNFATLRQIFYAQALAVWFKRNLKQALLNQVYANKGTVKGIDTNDAATNEAIYHQYLKAYKKGVFNFIKEDIDPVTQETLPRKYFSGGYADLALLSIVPAQPSATDLTEAKKDVDFAVLAVRPKYAAALAKPDAAMVVWAHIIQSGDTWYGLSRPLGTTVDQLAALNNLSPHFNLQERVGQTIKIGTNVPRFIYIVQSGDTMYEIASKVKITQDQLAGLNALPIHYQDLAPSQKLLIDYSDNAKIISLELRLKINRSIGSLMGVYYQNRSAYNILREVILGISSEIEGEDGLIKWQIPDAVKMVEKALAVRHEFGLDKAQTARSDAAVRVTEVATLTINDNHYTKAEISKMSEDFTVSNFQNALKEQERVRDTFTYFDFVIQFDNPKSRDIFSDLIMEIPTSKRQQWMLFVKKNEGEGVRFEIQDESVKYFIAWYKRKLKDINELFSDAENKSAVNNAAMNSDRQKPTNLLSEPNKDKAMSPFGGIDLSQQDAALHVEKDANGGVKVDVDPALIARIEREGMPEVVPVIINMQPADIRSLFGVETSL